MYYNFDLLVTSRGQTYYDQSQNLLNDLMVFISYSPTIILSQIMVRLIWEKIVSAFWSLPQSSSNFVLLIHNLREKIKAKSVYSEFLRCSTRMLLTQKCVPLRQINNSTLRLISQDSIGKAGWMINLCNQNAYSLYGKHWIFWLFKSIDYCIKQFGSTV